MAFLTGSNPYPSNTTAFTDDVVRVDITDRVKGYDPSAPGVVGKANEQPLTLLQKAVHLLSRIVGIEATLGGLDTTTLAGLDLLTLKYENTRQSVTVAGSDTTKAINLALGAVIALSLSNTAAVTLSFTNPRASMSGMLILTAVGADRTFILPSTWQPQELSRTLVVRSGQKRVLAFEFETISPVLVSASALSEPLLTT